MKYRKFGNLDWKVSVLGFGAMRLPLIDKDPAQVDVPEAIKMIRYAVDQGVNYIDTAFTYHGEQSEIIVGKALQDGYREKVKLATKLPSWLVEKPADFDCFLDGQLAKLRTDHIDFYLLHALNSTYWPKLRDWKAIEWAENAITDGKIAHLGFSFHDEFDVFQEIVDGYDGWTFCQIQYNYMDTEYQAGTKGLEYAADKGLAVVIMEPLRGGQLTQQVPASIRQIWNKSAEIRTPADWALQWIWNRPEVAVVLSGMSNMRQLLENITSANRAGVGTLSEADITLIDKVRDEYHRLAPVACTDCKYCLPCPNGVEIADILKFYNDAVVYENPRSSRFMYRSLNQDQHADNCVECFECEEKCPQGIPITERLKQAHALLDETPE